MAMYIDDEVVKGTAIETVKDNLLNAMTATQGAITVGQNIHKGDFIHDYEFQNLGEVDRRDPTSTADATAYSLNSIESVGVKLYFGKNYFQTLTEAKRYGTTPETISLAIGQALGNSVTRFAINKGLVAATAAILSQPDLVAGDGTGDPTPEILNDAVWKLGDVAEDVVAFVSPSVATSRLIGAEMQKYGSQVSYGTVYQGVPGTLGRSIWTVDSQALVSGKVILGLTAGAVTVDESEAIEFLSQLDLSKENAGNWIKTEGAYTVQIKGFKYDVTAGMNPDDSVLGAPANWSLVDQLKNAAGVAAKVNI